MTLDGRARRFRRAATEGARSRGALAAFGAFAAALLPACSSSEVAVECSSASHADGLFRGLVVGGTVPEGPFVVAEHEREPGNHEVVLVSLAEDEPRTCSLGKAFWYDTIRQGSVFGAGPNAPPLDARPARILTLEGEIGAKSGDLRVFDASCTERARVPSVDAPVRSIVDADGRIEAHVARTTAGRVVRIDPWAGAVRTIAEGAGFWTYTRDRFWLVEGGRLVVRDRDGNRLQTAGMGVTEVAIAPLGDEAAYVDEKGLWVLKAGDDEPAAIHTPAVPCKPEYPWSQRLMLAYREDCAAGVLAVQDRMTGQTRVFSSGVTSVRAYSGFETAWIFFEREAPGQARELWAVEGSGEPVLVGTNPRLDLLVWPHKAGFFFDLDHDGAKGTLGTWSLEAGFSPHFEGFVGLWRSGQDELAALADADAAGNVGTLVLFDSGTLAESLRVPRVHRSTPRLARQASALGYVRDWDDALGAGTLEAWISDRDQQIEVDTGVAEFGEVFWPKPGMVYAVHAPERAGLWSAHLEL
ncbi:hypothetical protein [Polyangium sp. 6x1]|uniref:hypothetical protein n=1 Tax=Polyangium sp. 6x1 TaxID=3042689 RepID=UPI002482A351|nr:hypothetical protein [Polyangium sp. 6x1]MDI1444163.1 hypothetical protein [Polyangium sp. 6x1]